MRKARETRITVGSFIFLVRRPTTLEMIEIQDQPRGRAILPFVIGWSGVKESDVLSSGDGHLLEFSADVCAEWLTDRLDLLAPIAEAVFAAFASHQHRMELTEKN